MNKLSKLQKICKIIGTVALLLYVIAILLGQGRVPLTFRLIAPTVGLIAYSIKCIVEIILEEKFGFSILLMALCICGIITSIVEIIMWLV